MVFKMKLVRCRGIDRGKMKIIGKRVLVDILSLVVIII